VRSDLVRLQGAAGFHVQVLRSAECGQLHVCARCLAPHVQGTEERVAQLRAHALLPYTTACGLVCAVANMLIAGGVGAREVILIRAIERALARPRESESQSAKAVRCPEPGTAGCACGM